MDNRKVVDLRREAKRLRIKRFSRLRKQELIDRIRTARNILDEEIPEIDSPILRPTRYVKPQESSEERDRKMEIRELEEMLGLRRNRHISRPEMPEEVERDLKIKRIKEINRQSRPQFRVTQSASALRGFARHFRILPLQSSLAGPREFMQMVRNQVLNLMRENRRTRVILILNSEMTRQELFSQESEETLEAHFGINPVENLESTDESAEYEIMIQNIEERIQNFNQRGSNWRFQRILSLDVHFTDYLPLRGSSFIELPKGLKSKKAVINMKNEDQQCFKWCVTRALNPVNKDPQRITKLLRKQSRISLKWGGMKFPVKVTEIDKFEKLNPRISINVFGHEGRKIYPLRISNARRTRTRDAFSNATQRSLHSHRTINLLLIHDGKNSHYCLIKDMSRLLRSQVTRHEESVVFCLRCLNHFPDEEKLRSHEVYCSNKEELRIEMPKEGRKIEFKNHNRMIKVPFVVYADFESIVKPIKSDEPSDENRSFTDQYQKHVPCGFSYKIVCFDDKIWSQDPVVFRAENGDEDVGQLFVEMLERDLRKIHKEFDFAKKMIFTRENRKEFEKAENCWICGLSLRKEGGVRDHCHFTGKYRGAAHRSCNLQFRKPKFTPVIFHNLANYDSHLFIKNLGKKRDCNEPSEKHCDIKCIPNNEEKYISFSKEIEVGSYMNREGKHVRIKHEIRFIDSFKFMASSLDNLVKNLSVDKLSQTKKAFEDKIDLLSRKGVYPYDHMTSIERFKETQLPPKEAFYSKLNDSGISDEEYEHAKRVWNETGIENMGDYHDLYLKSDVLLLADVFEEFRNVCLQNYDLDPAWYYTAPGLAWDAALKVSQVGLELLTDVDMLLMIEKGLRGGISMISKRYGKANNKYMGENYDPTKPRKFIEYLDANNLYGWAMCEPLPVGGFKWMTKEEIKNWKTSSLHLGSGHGVSGGTSRFSQ